MSLPAKIGRYEIISEIGRGGMGAVLKARDPVLERLVALKTMTADVMSEEGMRERFLREARSAARLQHPNIVTIYEFGEVGGAPFIAMELLAGENLADAVDNGHLPDLGSRIAVVIRLCDGLGYAHRNGVVHRDVKPTNVLLTGGGGLKIVDFGVAWLEGGTTSTRTGVLLGTPSYMAPEQFAGAPVDFRVDMWAVGVMLYELIAGRRPFDAGTVPALIYQIVEAPMPPLEKRSAAIPPRLAAIVERALAKDPHKRFPDLEAMADALGRVQSDLSTGVEIEQGAGVARDDIDTTRPELGPRPFALPAPRSAPVAGVPPSARIMPRTPSTAHAPFIDEGSFGEARKINTVLLSSDDAVLVAGGTDGAIHLWDLATRTKVATLRNRVHLRTGHGSVTTSLAFSDDGTLLASGHLDGAVYLWELETGLELDVRLNHEGGVGGVAFPPPGQILISAGADATLKFWDLAAIRKGDARRELRRQPDAITCMALAKMGRVVVTGHANRSIRVHDTVDHRLVATLHGHHSPLAALAVSPLGDLVASGARDGIVRVHRIDTRDQRWQYQEHTRAIVGLAFFPDGTRIASVAMDNALVVWDTREPELPTNLLGAADDNYAAVCITSDGRRVICAGADGRFRVWLAIG
jgi:tRNA A-37 threonylcarbamoyl transferase component Bud32